MSSDADKMWEDLAPKLRKKQGFCPLTPEEAEAEYNNAPIDPISKEKIKSMVDAAISRTDDDWTEDEDWGEDSALDEAASGNLQLFRNEGEKTPETDQKEDELRRRMLGDDDPEEDET